MLKLFPLILVLWANSALAMSPELGRIVSDVRQGATYGPHPVVITDLDETVIDSSPRRFAALRVAVNEACGKLRAGDCGRATGLNLSEFYALENRYDLDPLFDRVGMGRSAWRKSLLDRTLNLYLSGFGLELDQALPGAVEFLQALRESGATVFYISSRYEQNQLAGTLRNLRDLGIIEASEEERVILRPEGMSSIEFKRRSFQRVKEWTEARQGAVRVVMENEPENMNAMTDLFPKAHAVFVEGAHILQEPVRHSPLRLKDYR